MASSFPALSLIQGVSEQSAFSRSQSSAEAQKNCVNDMLYGSRARNGSRVKSVLAWNASEAFFHRIERSPEEDYLVVAKGTDLRIINLASGVEATITLGITSGQRNAYMAHTGDSRVALVAATVEDVTFLGNRQRVMQMAATLSPARPNWALVHFKSANYSTDYKVHVKWGATTVTASYKTPDNSVAANADFIATNALAEEFKDALDTALSASGFTVERRSSSILISHPSHDFTVSSEDGLGGQQLISFKDRVKKLTDLPAVCWDGYQVAVGTTKSASEVDYFLEYSGSEQDGVWEEVVAPETPTTIDASTMPLRLTNTGLNAFTLSYAPWGTRLAGDGVNTAKNPSFIGRKLVDLQFFDSRLAIIGEGYWSLSRSQNVYVFFPDTVQTNLKTAPIDYTVANGKVSLISRAVVMAENLQLWANGIQSVVSGGQDALTEDTAENPPTTAYEYDGVVPPVPIGMGGLVFTTSMGLGSSITEVIFRNGKAIGEMILNDHCPSLVRGQMRGLYPAGTLKALMCKADENPERLYVYQWYNRGDERLQSAWNYWDFPNSTEVLWAGASGSRLRMLVLHGSVTTVEEIEFGYAGDEYGLVPLRADHRFREDDLTVTDLGGELQVDLLVAVPEAKRPNFVVYERENDDETGEQRGKLHTVTWVSTTRFTIASDNPDLRFWVGYRISSEREFGRLYISDRNGTVTTDSVQIDFLTVFHTNSVGYDLVITPKNQPEDRRVESFSARRIGDPSIINSRLAVEASGKTDRIKVGYKSDEVTLTLRNNTIYPSSWEAVDFTYRAEKRAQ